MESSIMVELLDGQGPVGKAEQLVQLSELTGSTWHELEKSGLLFSCVKLIETTGSNFCERVKEFWPPVC